MRKIKKFAAVCMVAALVMVVYPNMESNTLTVSAHRGRTHSYEEYHHNRKQAEPDCDYYYCDGHSAHLHNHGVCPYADGPVSANTLRPGSVSENTVDTDKSANTPAISDTRNGRHHNYYDGNDAGHGNDSIYHNKHQGNHKRNRICN